MGFKFQTLTSHVFALSSPRGRWLERLLFVIVVALFDATVSPSSSVHHLFCSIDRNNIWQGGRGRILFCDLFGKGTKVYLLRCSVFGANTNHEVDLFIKSLCLRPFHFYLLGVFTKLFEFPVYATTIEWSLNSFGSPTTTTTSRHFSSNRAALGILRTTVLASQISRHRSRRR